MRVRSQDGCGVWPSRSPVLVPHPCGPAPVRPRTFAIHTGAPHTGPYGYGALGPAKPRTRIRVRGHSTYGAVRGHIPRRHAARPALRPMRTRQATRQWGPGVGSYACTCTQVRMYHTCGMVRAHAHAHAHDIKYAHADLHARGHAYGMRAHATSTSHAFIALHAHGMLVCLSNHAYACKKALIIYYYACAIVSRKAGSESCL